MAKKPISKAVQTQPNINIEFEALYTVASGNDDKDYQVTITKQEVYKELPSLAVLEPVGEAWKVKELPAVIQLSKAGLSLTLWGIAVNKLFLDHQTLAIEREQLFIL